MLVLTLSGIQNRFILISEKVLNIENIKCFAKFKLHQIVQINILKKFKEGNGGLDQLCSVVVECSL